MQTNRINGQNLIACLSGKFPESLVGLDAGGSPNHEVEAAVVQLGAYGIVRWDPIGCINAAHRCLDLLMRQATGGLMWKEAGNDSHSPIWLRAMLAQWLWSDKLKDHGPTPAELASKTILWHQQNVRLLSEGYVPRGLLAGQILLPCARKKGIRTGKTPEISGKGGRVGDQVRDVYYATLTGGKLPPTGKQFWVLSNDRQDTAAGPILRMLLPPVWKPADLPMPLLCSKLIVTHYADGHTGEFPDGLPGTGDAAPAMWVKYSSGEWWFGQRLADGHVPDLGTKMSQTVVQGPA